MDSKKLNVGDSGDEVAHLHEKLSRCGFNVSAEEVKRKFFGPSTRAAVRECQKRNRLNVTGTLDEATATSLSAMAPGGPAGSDIVEPAAVLGAFPGPSPVASRPGAPGGSGPGHKPPKNDADDTKTGDYEVEGRIFFEHGLPAGEVTLRLYSRGFGGAEKQLAEIKTDAQGHYALPYDPGGQVANIEVRVVDAEEKEIPLSATKFNAGKKEVLNLVAPTSVQPLTAEYQRLTADLGQHLDSLDNLSEARENGDQRDLTLLHQATGWDARLIALTANSVKLSQDTGIPGDALYALFRLGLPTDKEQLALLNASIVEKALNKAKDAGIVDLNDQQINQAKDAFINFSRQNRLQAMAPGALSNFGELLGQSGLTSSEQNLFADLVFTHQGASAELWQQAQAQGISAPKINGLKQQGKLAYLTFNNATLTNSLQQELGSSNDLSQLIDKDLHTPAGWKSRLNGLAATEEELKGLIPPGYAGESAADLLEGYAADMARKVRLSYPTQIVRKMVDQEELPLGDGVDKNDVVDFFDKALAVDKDFRLGQVPLKTFIQDHWSDLFPGASSDSPPPEIDKTIEATLTITRVYQFTPSDESLKVVLDCGLESAQDVMAFTLEEFLERFGDKFPSLEEAELVYRKAQQIASVTHNVATAAKQLDNSLTVYGMSPPPEVKKAAKAELIKRFPTMQALFGSLDFCECEHCRSVLSPAAYLVDLLQFLDPEDINWQTFLDHWKKMHNDEPYKSDWDYDHTGEAYEDQRKKPYYALIERRPDLPHLPLTCENTHTALPYIDLVNEILEYYVAHDKLEAQASHDTGEATTPELLAEPQNVLPNAYEKLNAACYPLGLPFDLWLETVRAFFDHSETPLWQVLKVFRPADELFAPAANPKPYYRADIFAEYLGLSPAEVAIYTNTDPLGTWYKLYGYENETVALSGGTDSNGNFIPPLKTAKNLSRRLAVSYKELVDLISTAFINPDLDALVVLRKLGIDTEDVFRYKASPGYSPLTEAEREEFEARLAALTAMYNPEEGDPTGFEAKTWLDTAWENGDFDRIFVLADPSSGCNFDETTLLRVSDRAAYADEADVYAANRDVYALVLLKLNLFVRLWRALGWTIEETDRALQVFLPTNSDLSDPTKLGEALRSALVHLAHLKVLDEKIGVGKNSRLRLLTLWSNLATTGKNSLYAQLFLTPSILKNDPVFDDPLGDYLSQGNVLIQDHVLALQGALNLTADEIGRILAETGQELGTAALSLDNVSLLYRYGLLAKALKLSVRELITLKQLSGLEPFHSLEQEPITTLDQDHPYTQTLRFVEVADKVKDSRFTVADLDYLLRHRFDPTGAYRAGSEAPLALLKTLADGIHRIRAEHPISMDLTNDLLGQKLALVLPPDVAEAFISMLTGTIVYEANAQPSSDSSSLNPSDFEDEPAIQVSFNSVTNMQRLTYRGVLTHEEKTRLQAKYPLLATLLDDVHRQAKHFFEQHLQVNPISSEHTFGFLDATDFELLFAPMLTGTGGEAQQQEKQQRLTQAFVPYLHQQLTRQLIVQTLATDLDADLALTEALLVDSKLLSDPGQAGTPLLAAFSGSGERGVSAAFFDSAGSQIDGTITAVTTDTGLEVGAVPIKPPNADGVRFEGYVEVPAAEAYRFFVVLGKENAEAELRFAHLPVPLIQGKAAADGDELSDFVELKPGIPYRFSLAARNLQNSDIRLLVQGESLPKGSLSQLTLYPAAVVTRLHHAQLLLAKTLQLIGGLALNEREVRYLLTHAADFDNLDLSKLPASALAVSDAEAMALFGQILRLASYARLKRKLAGGADDLITVFENARRTHTETDPEKAKIAHFKPVADITRREAAMVMTVAEKLGFTIDVSAVDSGQRVETPDLAHERGLWRLWLALQVVEKLGVPVESIVRWTQIIDTAKTPDERFTIARDLRNTVKARFETEDWQRIAQPIFDKLRRRQRDALVAYIMHKKGFARMEQLFEHFLIDPGIEPVVRTSRLRLAISSVQLFIQRCLLNLERNVNPSVINSKHWGWMKRYRVWEANRKIFLYPENWLEPEFRDDKTHLFQELEGALLQGDVSNDLVEDAFFNYSKKLEALARLDIMTIYCEEKPLDPAANTLHVIGRTFSQPHKYFYRRYAHGMWTPWEPVTAEIEGDHVVAVVWRERLHLFWVTIMEKAKKEQSGSTSISSNASAGDIANAVLSTKPKMEVEAQLNWTEYFQGQWTSRESGGFGVPIRQRVPNDFNSNEVFVHVSKDHVDNEAVNIHLQFSRAIVTTKSHGVNWSQAGQYLFLMRQPNGGPEPEFGIDTDTGTDTNINTNGKFAPPDYFGPSGKEYVSQVNWKFRLVGKNSQPEIKKGNPPPRVPYLHTGREATQHKGSNDFQIELVERSETEDGKPAKLTTTPKTVLRQGTDFSLTSCSHSSGLLPPEIAALVSPFFYQDSQHTFFVMPSLTETTIERWEEWVITTPQLAPLLDEDWWGKIPVQPMVPMPIDPEAAVWTAPIDPLAKWGIRPGLDWVINPATAFEYDDSLVGSVGGLGAMKISGLSGLDQAVSPFVVNAGSGLPAESGGIGPAGGGFSPGGSNITAHLLNVIGNSGLSPVLLDAIYRRPGPNAGPNLINPTRPGDDLIR